jgi:prepilin peptidase CpaA
MEILEPFCWPLWFICLAMIASAVIDWWMFKVPNWLTFPIIISGWIFGLIHTFGGYIVEGDGVGGIGSSLAGTAVGSVLLLVYMIGGMGAGDVKMTMGFGSWMGAFFGLGAWEHILLALCVGIIAGGIIGLGMMALRGQYRQNAQMMQVIIMDLFTSGSLGKVAAKAKERRPRWHRLPYGVPLCIGFVGYLWVAHPLIKPEASEQPSAQSSMHLAIPPSQLARCWPHIGLQREPVERRDVEPLLGPHKTQS